MEPLIAYSLHAALDTTREPIVLLDGEWRIVYMNPIIEKMLGKGKADLVGQRLWDLYPEALGTAAFEECHRARAHQIAVTFEYQGSGRDVWYEAHAHPYANGLLVNVRDITERKRNERDLHFLAFHDPLTRLENRAALMKRIDRAITQCLTASERVALLFLDVDRFKEINDTLGHHIGDRLLVAIANRLRSVVSSRQVLARLGGDEFAVVLSGLHGDQEAMDVAAAIVEAMEPPFEMEDRTFSTSISVGVALSAAEPQESQELLRQAGLALHYAKLKGKNRYELYDPDMDVRSRERLEMVSELRAALQQADGLLVYYQPIVRMPGGHVEGVEALVRWNHPVRGFLAPGDFIPVAEESGLILPLNLYVLEKACAQVSAWNRGGAALRLSVNISTHQFQQADLVARLEASLSRTGLHPRCLQLEITESAMIQEIEAARATLQQIRALGVSIAIDDFGKGYSSLSYLKGLPVDLLKVDRSFVQGLGTDLADRAIVASVIAIAQVLGIEVTAEGIETAEQMEHLLSLSCNRGQGFYFARPMPAQEFQERFLRPLDDVSSPR